MDTTSRIYIAGHRGLVGSAIKRNLEACGYINLITRTSKELDLREQAQVREFIQTGKPEYVFLAAARVGGIHANNTYPADFIGDNLLLQTNVIHESWRAGVKKLLFLGSSCIYPRLAPQPMREEHLLSGPLEPTNEWYAVAKISGIKMCQAYKRQHGFDAISCMPTNLYGPGDNFHPDNSHVLPALIRRFHEAREAGLGNVTVWGTGSPRREFLHVDDLADACRVLMERYDGEQFVNVGTGSDLTIRELALMVAEVTGFEGEVLFDSSKPDGTPQKLLDVSKLSALGWTPSIPLRQGIEETYQWFLDNQDSFRR